MSSTLEQLRDYSGVVADTGDLLSIARLKPVDATTNPSLILQAAKNPAQRDILLNVVEENAASDVATIARALAVRFAIEISKLVTGRVSIEVDARLSYDTQATYNEALLLIELLASQGISREQVLIKIAATWQGIAAAKMLEQAGIHCNLTLVFSEAQAIACANAGAYLISPFVGRILDWHKAAYPDTVYEPRNDPGVVSVKRIFDLFKKTNTKTIVMGASFRSVEQVIALAGCDKLTVSPALLDQLADSDTVIEANLNTPLDNGHTALEVLDEAQFEQQLASNLMASQKLAEGVDAFAADQQRLESLITELLDNIEAA